MNDKQYMSLALEIAKKGVGQVNPNPLVGCVIVKNDKIIGRGYHEKYGGLHAERNALTSCTQSVKGATMYVTLEPCCHYGKTPPCTEAIIESSISKVIIGTLDPNEKVQGKGVDILRNSGVEVVVGVLKDECKRLNEVFFHFIQTKIPHVVMKYAMTMDGKIATATGQSKWITGEMARENVHKDRNRYSAIMVGVGTVLNDNPLLTCRIQNGRNPVRIICDTNLRIPFDCNIVSTSKKIQTIIATSEEDTQKHKPFLDAGCEIIVVSKTDGHINLKEFMKKLGERGIDSVLIEGGSTLNFSVLSSGIINKVQTYIAPKLFGGNTAKTPVGGNGFSEISNAVKLKNTIVSQFGEDILIESEVDNTCLQES